MFGLFKDGYDRLHHHFQTKLLEFQVKLYIFLQNNSHIQSFIFYFKDFKRRRIFSSLLDLAGGQWMRAMIGEIISYAHPRQNVLCSIFIQWTRICNSVSRACCQLVRALETSPAIKVCTHFYVYLIGFSLFWQCSNGGRKKFQKLDASVI